MMEMAKLQEQVLEMQLNQDDLIVQSRLDKIVLSADSLLNLIEVVRPSYF